METLQKIVDNINTYLSDYILIVLLVGNIAVFIYLINGQYLHRQLQIAVKLEGNDAILLEHLNNVRIDDLLRLVEISVENGNADHNRSNDNQEKDDIFQICLHSGFRTFLLVKINMF